jgi:hypothetical protein
VSKHLPKFLLLIALLIALAAAALVLNRRLDQDLSLAAPQPTPAPPNYTLIEPGLYIGGRVAAPPPDVNAVLSLTPYPDDYTTPIHEWHPILDAAPARSLDWLRQQVQFIDAQRRDGNIVFVHCEAGVSRSAMVCAAYFMWRNHWTRDQALAFLRTTRPIVSPNSAFMDLLTEWEQSQ